MSTRTIVLSFVSLILLGVSLYYWGLIYSFRNFGTESGDRYMEEYTLAVKKDLAEQRIYELINKHPVSYSMPDTGLYFKRDGWFKLYIHSPNDTVFSIFRFAGDSINWKNEAGSKVLVFNIEKRGYEFTGYIPATNKQTQNELIELFEDRVIDSLNATTNLSQNE